MAAKIKNRLVIYLFFIVLFMGIYLTFTLNAGYWSDDSLRWYLRGYLHLSDQETIWSYICSMELAMESIGRFTPGSNLVVAFVLILPLGIYRLYLCVLCMLCACVFFYMMFQITENEDIAFLMSVSSVILFRIIPYNHNVLLSFGGNSIWTLLFCLSATACWEQYLKKGRRRDHCLFLIFFELSLLTYEIAYLFLFLYLGLAILRYGLHFRKLCKSCCAMSCVFLVNVCWYLLIKIRAGASYDGTTVSINIKNMLHGFYSSLIAPLPFVTWLMQDHVSLHVGVLRKHVVILCIALLFVLAVRYMFQNIKKNGLKKSDDKTDDKTIRTKLVLLVIGYLMFPACIMCVTEKYQTLPLGIGYIVIIFQYFGVGILIGSVFWSLFSGLKNRNMRVLFIGLYLLYGIGLIVTNQVNSYEIIDKFEVNTRQNLNDKDSVRFIESVAKSELLKGYCVKGKKIVCSDETEQYKLASFCDYQLIVKKEDEKNNKDLLRLKFYGGFCVMGNWVDDQEDIVDNAVIYINESAGSNNIVFLDINGNVQEIDLKQKAKIQDGGGFYINLDKNIKCKLDTFFQKKETNLRIGETVEFRDGSQGVFHLNNNFSIEEYIVWTLGKRSLMYFELEDCPDENIMAILNLAGAVNENQKLRILANGQEVCNKGNVMAGELKFGLPELKDGRLILELQLDYATIPPNDLRNLGIAMISLKFDKMDERTRLISDIARSQLLEISSKKAGKIICSNEELRLLTSFSDYQYVSKEEAEKEHGLQNLERMKIYDGFCVIGTWADEREDVVENVKLYVSDSFDEKSGIVFQDDKGKVHEIDLTKESETEDQGGYDICLDKDIKCKLSTVMHKNGKEYQLGEVIELRYQAPGLVHINENFSVEEHFIWTLGKKCVLYFALEDDPDKMITAIMDLAGVVNDNQKLCILANGQEVFYQEKNISDEIVFEMEYPADGNLFIELQLDNATALPNDNRQLGIALSALKLESR